MYVELSVEDLRTGVRSPPPPPYLVFDRKPLNPSNSNGYSRFYCVEEFPEEAEIEARRTEMLG